DDATLPILHRADVELDFRHLDAHRRRMLRLFVQVGRSDERLGRYAAPVEADPTNLFFLDARHFLLELAEPNRARVTARTAPDHHRVVASVRHLALPGPDHLSH